MVGLDKPLARIWVSSLTCGSAKQAFGPNVRLKAWHGGARQTFGPNLGFKFDMRERKTSVLPQCKTNLWPESGVKVFDMRECKTSVLPQCKVEGLAWWGNLWPEFGFQV